MHLRCSLNRPKESRDQSFNSDHSRAFQLVTANQCPTAAERAAAWNSKQLQVEKCTVEPSPLLHFHLPNAAEVVMHILAIKIWCRKKKIGFQDYVLSVSQQLQAVLDSLLWSSHGLKDKEHYVVRQKEVVLSKTIEMAFLLSKDTSFQWIPRPKSSQDNKENRSRRPTWVWKLLLTATLF